MPFPLVIAPMMTGNQQRKKILWDSVFQGLKIFHLKNKDPKTKSKKAMINAAIPTLSKMKILPSQSPVFPRGWKILLLGLKILPSGFGFLSS